MGKPIKKTSNNFGATGWYYIILTAILFFVNTVISVDGLNVTIAEFSAEHGWASTTLLNYSTFGGYVSIAAAVLISWLMAKRGTRFIMALTLFIGGAVTIWWGSVTTTLQYLIACAIVCACTNGYSHIASSNLAAVWFPTRKGLFLGWSTMGVQLSSVIGVALLSVFLNSVGLANTYLIVGLFQIALGILVLVTVKDTPEEAGKFPDNIPMTEAELNDYKEANRTYTSQWRMIDLLKDREVWLIAIPFGILYMASIGLLSQWVPRLVGLGYEENTAITILAVAAAIGFVGSYTWGWLDVKYGPKKASIGIMINYVVAIIVTILPYHPALLYLSVFLIGMGIGGVANLVASLTATVFGPREFAKAYGIINPLMGIIRVSAFSVLAFGLEYFGGYSGAYSIFLVFTIIGTILICFVREEQKKAPKDHKEIR